MTIPFTKMHGLGNDYIYVNTLSHSIPDPCRASMLWSDRHKGIGADGLVLIGESKVADFSMRIFNADGSEAMMCGNASRCIGKYVYDNKLTRKTEVTLETLSGIKRLSLHLKDGIVESVTVDMGEPSLCNSQQVATPQGSLREQELHVMGKSFTGTFVSMGNPHLVIFVPEVEDITLSEYGPILECHPLFPQRTNVEFASLRKDGTVRMRVWERGSGITQACGTGACATTVAAILTQHTARSLSIDMDGGSLMVEWSETDNHVYMTGTATKVFDGIIEL